MRIEVAFFKAGANIAFCGRYVCENKLDAFRYVCKCNTLLCQRRDVTLFVKRAYYAYFQIPLGGHDKSGNREVT